VSFLAWLEIKQSHQKFDFWIPVVRMSAFLIASLAILASIIMLAAWFD